MGWLKATGATLLERFGMTEFGLALSNPYRQGPRVDSSVGMPLPGYEAALADEAGGRLPAPPAGTAGVSASGELLIRGPGLFSSYWGKPAATAEVFTPDGWFRTGDSAHVDGRGYYYIDGRLSADIIKSGGYKISALEIERVMLEHAGVAEVAVFGMPHDVYGEAVVALVVPQGDVAAALPPVPAAAAGGLALHRGPAAAAAAATLRAWAKGAMAAYKVPSDIAFVAELPRNAMGKINKKELRAAYAAAVAAAAVSPPSHHR